MMLCEEDIQRLEKAGYCPEKFARYDTQGYAKLRNRKGYCFFYDAEKRRCRVYKVRPLGCRIYPVIYSEEEGVIVDGLCPERRSVLKREVEAKGRKVMDLLKKIDFEAERRRKP
jgi:Fe-S-cluster containining protein